MYPTLMNLVMIYLVVCPIGYFVLSFVRCLRRRGSGILLLGVLRDGPLGHFVLVVAYFVGGFNFVISNKSDLSVLTVWSYMILTYLFYSFPICMSKIR